MWSDPPWEYEVLLCVVAFVARQHAAAEPRGPKFQTKHLHLCAHACYCYSSHTCEANMCHWSHHHHSFHLLMPQLLHVAVLQPCSKGKISEEWSASDRLTSDHPWMPCALLWRSYYVQFLKSQTWAITHAYGFLAIIQIDYQNCTLISQQENQAT